jgi:hypothetical protein
VTGIAATNHIGELVVPMSAHPELIVARRNVALASDKLRALQDEALRLSVFVIPFPDRIDALIDIARANGLFSVRGGHQAEAHRMVLAEPICAWKSWCSWRPSR